MLDRSINLVTKLAMSFAHRQRLIVLNYHRVLAEPDIWLPHEPDAKHFAKQLEWLSKNFEVVDLVDGLDSLYESDFERPKVAITFDDGYRNNAEIALPILQRYGMSATFFVVEGELNHGIMWNDKIMYGLRNTPHDQFDINMPDGSVIAFERSDQKQFMHKAEKVTQIVKYLSRQERESFVSNLLIQLDMSDKLPTELMLTDDQVKELHSSGMRIGLHAHKHDVLTSITLAEAEQEIKQAKSKLEGLVDDSVETFAFPNGKPTQDYTNEHVEIVKNLGFKYALSTTWGACQSSSPRYELPRLMPWRQSQLGFSMNLVESIF